MNKKLTGVVEAVGTKFNGSLMLEGKWYNAKKGVSLAGIEKGSTVTLTLNTWEFNGKSGVNISSVEASEAPEVEEKPSITSQVAMLQNIKVQGRDFDKEARGKTMCQYISAQLSNPGLDINDLNAIYDRAKTLTDKTFE